MSKVYAARQLSGTCHTRLAKSQPREIFEMARAETQLLDIETAVSCLTTLGTHGEQLVSLKKLAEKLLMPGSDKGRSKDPNICRK